MSLAKERVLINQLEALFAKTNSRVEQQSAGGSLHTPEAVQLRIREIEALHRQAEAELAIVSAFVFSANQP